MEAKKKILLFHPGFDRKHFKNPVLPPAGPAGGREKIRAGGKNEKRAFEKRSLLYKHWIQSFEFQ